MKHNLKLVWLHRQESAAVGRKLVVADNSSEPDGHIVLKLRSGADRGPGRPWSGSESPNRAQWPEPSSPTSRPKEGTLSTPVGADGRVSTQVTRVSGLEPTGSAQIDGQQCRLAWRTGASHDARCYAAA